MVVLGIDPGTATTGYGFVREVPEGIQLVTYGVLSTPAGMPMEKRLLQLHAALTELLMTITPASAAVEKLFFQRNVSTAMTVGQARGVVLLSLAQAGIPVGEYTPLEIKQAVAGYGGADKTQVQQMVKALLNLDRIPQPDDAADALAVAICHLHSMRMKSLLE